MEQKAINTKLPVSRCWDMVNRIQQGNSAEEIRRRCRVAEAWLKANEVIDNDQYDDLMMTVAWIHRESYRM